MHKHHFLFTLGALFVLAGLFLLASPGALAQDSTNPEEPPFLADYFNQWVTSAHAKADAEAFVHWNSEGEIPESCAKCHSSTGYLDFLGEDGSEAGVVNAPAAVGTVVTCDTCHNSTTTTMTSVVFPSGMEVVDASGSARCMQCHQGRASTESVNAAIEKVGLTGQPDTVNAELGFVNIHYYAAAATLYGTEAHGGYQYEGMAYELKNEHVPGFDSCADCHNTHTLEVKVEACAECHEDVETVEDLKFIRMPGSAADYDGDGDMDEGISEEISTLQEMLYEAIQGYAGTVAGSPIVYDEATHPYFFIDTNDNGDVDEGEATGDNKYVSFTPNLLEAAYNYQVSIKDPGGFAHNPTYLIHLLYDSITMLNGAAEEPFVDMADARRNSPGHFDTTGEPFRHWDAEGEVPGSCAKCHSSSGLPTYLKNGTNIAVEPSNSLACTTCHDSLTEFTTYVVNEVTFPSGAKVSFGEEDENNLCLNCHQGRESTVSVNRAITTAGVGDDEVSDKLAFRNVHYFAAGASLFGTEVKGAYEFEGKEYNGRNVHAGGDEDAPQDCTSCHFKHELTVQIEDCADCHEDVETPEDVRLIRAELEDVEPVDYDGDGDTDEPIADEMAAFEDALLTNLQAYATKTAGAGIIYNSAAYPYWFTDTNGNGTGDPDELNNDNRYVTWTPNLLRAAYNYQYVQKDPGGFAHNSNYLLQVLYDSIEAVGGAEAVAGFTRPEVVAPAPAS